MAVPMDKGDSSSKLQERVKGNRFTKKTGIITGRKICKLISSIDLIYKADLFRQERLT